MLISSLILLPLLVQLELESNVNSSNFMVVHCLPCNYRIYIVFIAYIYMQNLPAEINSIYAYINPIVAVLLGALILEKHLQW
jgi:drug/metabolite transporter (DMT)-like permease